jgi:hypothetical protein
LDGVSITNSTINSSVIGGVTPAAGTFTNIATTTGTITAVPSGPTSIVNQAYVDAVAQGLSFKQPAAFTTSGDITLSGLSTQAGGDWPSTLTAGDRILVRNQTAQEDNGIYVAASGAWARAADANTYDEFLSAYLFVISGTVYSGSAWVCTNQPGGTLGVTPIVFIQFSNTALYNAGTGLTLTGFTFSITNTGVTAASYGSASDTLTATVNAQGQLTSLAASPIAILNTQVSGLGTMSTQNANTVAITGGNIDGTTIGGTTPAAVTGTTVTANTQFSGPGTGLTGTASALSIGGNAATSTSATTATNLAGGATGSLPYQSGAGATTFLAAGTNGHVLTLAGGVPTWAAEQFQGDVVGPASATDNALARYDGTSGKLIQNSTVTLSDAGALQNVNEINFDTTPTSVVGGQGSLFWNSSEGTLDLVMRGGNTTQHIGEEVFYTARNATGSTINKATPVYASGVTAGSKRIEISPMIADGSIDELRFVGLTSENISNGVNGFVTDFGYIRNIDTSGAPYGQTWATGDIIYVSPTTAGYLTNVLPVAPNLKIVVALVIEADNNFGVLLVRPTVYPQIENLSNVNISTVTGGDLLVYDGTDARWENAAQSTITAGKATNLAGGSAGQVPYQSAADTTGFTSTGTAGQVLTSQGTSAPTWTTPVAAVTVTDDTTTNAARYPLYADATSGTLATTFVSSTKYQFNPSTGVLTATSFSGAGTGLTGTASGLSIGGNAATATSATSATTATNLAGGANGSLPYQTGSGATTFLGIGTTGQLLTVAGGVPTWAAAPQTGVTITDDTSTNATRYITFTDATTGTETGLDVSSTKLQFNPSTGTLSTTVLAAPTIKATGTSSSEGKLEFYEDTDNGTNYVAIKAPASIASDVTWTLPSADGTNGQTLTTNGSGALSWATASGGLAWQSVQTSNFTAGSNQAYPVNTTSAAITVTLPASPSAGDTILFVDYAGTWQTNFVTFDRNSKKIQGIDGNYVASSKRESVTLTYIDSTQGWIVTNDAYLGNAPLTIPVEYLVVAGGGGGGGNAPGGNSGGGGGAGGYLSGTIGVQPSINLTVTVGAGGSAGAVSTNGGNGSNSVLSTISSTGGGGGGHGTATSLSTGGSGGGSYNSSINGGLGISGQGNNGGKGSSDSLQAGGGGGASQAGADATTTVAGKGGDGTASSITGSSVTRAGGGGGGSYLATPGTSGSGGGGTGAVSGTPATAGTVNTGGGGGGGSRTSGGAAVASAAGGSGIVVIKYPDTFTCNVGAGLTSSETSSGGFKIRSFTAGTGVVSFS